MTEIEKIYEKIRALITDLSKSDFETFSYTTSAIFTLSESNINPITKVLKNGTELGSGDYSYDSTTNKIEIIVSLIVEDIIEVDYTYYKYSDTELNEWIRASLVWISYYAFDETDYELESNEIFPTPSNTTNDLISLVSSILIKPDYTTYRLPTLTVSYPRTMSKDERIQKLITRFNHGMGVNGTLEFTI